MIDDILSTNAVVAITGGGTRFWHMSGGNTHGPTENRRWATVQYSCQVLLPTLKVTANTTTNDSLLILRVNSTSTALVVTVPAGLTGDFQNVVDVVNLSPGDIFNWRFEAGTGGNLTLTNCTSVLRTPERVSKLMAHTTSSTAVNSTLYVAMGGSAQPASLLVAAQSMFKSNGKLKNACMTIVSNTITAATSYVLLLNGSATALVVTVPASTTGVFEDTINEVSIAPNDLAVWEVITGAGTSLLMTNCSVDFFVSDRKFEIIGGHAPGFAVTTRRWFCMCHSDTVKTSAAQAEHLVPFKFKARDLRVFISVNGAAVSRSYIVFKNATSTALSAVVPASSTGWFENSTDEIDFDAGDSFFIQYDTTVSSSITNHNISFTGVYPGGQKTWGYIID